MDDAVIVRALQGVGDLDGDGNRLVERNRRDCDPVRQRRPLDELHGERAEVALAFLEAEDLRDVGMVERRERLRFALETREPIGIAGQRRPAGP